MSIEVSLSDHGRRILIADDEPAIAMLLEEHCREVGLIPVGPALSKADIAVLLAGEQVHGAIVDAGMLGGHGADLLASLVEKGTPFVYLTGYEPDGLHPSLPLAERFHKPSRLEEVVDRLQVLMAAAPT